MKKSLLSFSIFTIFLIAFYSCKSDKSTFIQEKNSNGGIAIWWNPRASFPVRVNPPVIIINDKIISNLTVDKSIQSNDSLAIYYRFSFPGANGSSREGIGNLILSLKSYSDDHQYIIQHSTIQFDDTIHTDVSVKYSFDILKKNAIAMIAEKMELSGRMENRPKTVIVTRGLSAHSLSEGNEQAAYFEMGYHSTDTAGYRLSMPVTGLIFRSKSELLNLAVSADPYSGTQYYAKNISKATQITLLSRYSGSVFPLKQETKTIVLEYTKSTPDEIINSFYKTIPEIAPAPAWVHDIAMAYYDYNSDNGKGWYRDMEAMEKKCPKELRNRIVVCIHGWYNNTGKYCYDEKTGTLLDNWKAFANPHPNYKSKKKPVDMSKQEIHNRIKFAKDRGFRVILYYADGTNCTGSMETRENEVFRYADNSTFMGWMGPDGGGPALDPSFEEVRKWYKGYLEALLKEYGKELDGFVFDETNLFLADDVSYRITSNPQYADRAMMEFMKELTIIIQQWRQENPNLVIMEGSHYFYGLTANGSFTDYSGLPTIINYRNTSWSCIWMQPGIRNVHTHIRTRKDIDYPYGLDLGLSNGWDTDTGPSEMDPKILDEVFQRFLQRTKEGPETPKIKIIDGLDSLLKR